MQNPNQNSSPSGTVFAGIDASRDHLVIALNYGEHQSIRTIKANRKHVRAFFSKQLMPGTSCVAAYEAGESGFWLQRELRRLGIQCFILVPSSLLRQRIKTDVRDASAIAAALQSGDITETIVRTDIEEALRLILTQRRWLVEERTRYQQRAHSVLVQSGLGEREVTRSLLKSRVWPDLPAAQHEVLDFLCQQIDSVDQQIKACENKVKVLATDDSLDERIRLLRGFRGIDTMVAAALIGDLGDLRRFPDPGRLASFLGLVPRARSSGRALRSLPGVGRSAGLANWYLTQAASCHMRGFQLGAGTALRRRASLPESVCARIEDYEARLHEACERLTKAGKPRKIIQRALARKLSAFIWYVMTEATQPSEEL